MNKAKFGDITHFTTHVSACEPMEFFSCSWSVSLRVCNAFSPVLLKVTLSNSSVENAIPEGLVGESEEAFAMVSKNPFSFASSKTSQMIWNDEHCGGVTGDHTMRGGDGGLCG
ncbi:hypothetical protein VNO80_10535 [Phaseolus coccineus]|uniref:Uncharacterized protein n=1 Tax=Phaseolus coccineus TaxID=3886 RepID=A0AAN9REQ1_PHACN